MAITDETSKVIRKELERLNAERDQIEDAISKLEGALVSLTRSAGRSARKAVGRKPAPKSKAGRKTGGSQAWKPSGRAAEALKTIKASPGISGAEVAKKLKLNNNTAVYPVLNKLKTEGYIKKQGKGYSVK
jgi:hypothetical protein